MVRLTSLRESTEFNQRAPPGFSVSCSMWNSISSFNDRSVARGAKSARRRAANPLMALMVAPASVVRREANHRKRSRR
jgi:hypothetical protein